MQPLSTPSGPARRKRQAGSAGADSPDFITALARGLHVLRCFRSGPQPLGNQELAHLTGLPKPTISRITFTLTELGYLRYHADTGKYSPGHAALAMGFGLLAGLAIRDLAKADMTALAAQTGAAVALGAFDGDAMVYVEAMHGSSALYLRLPVGYRASLDTAMGRAYLAALPEPARQELVSQAGITSHAMDEALRDRQASGCCFAIGQWQSGINAAAVAFSALTGEGVFVISCGGPAQLLPEATLRDRVAPVLNQIARRLEGG
ncbi:IclR family transcriptional regulator [Bordetella holmesii]|uniref:Transcriptional regulator, IclR family, C-terminal domain protein n=2 Tax=Bordetella holmesii TaxID=35814 RepID=A0A158M0S6_9BORD|nr:IclR family transcriptional regulator [Bordetella holmesii]AHV92482.1 bacterial transcriptional regulator family protein [Bordetella holmesii ATCC 51541]AIT27232.1 bacterial transcriptional regulator family protein [Bordetella holmesii 44057]EWM41456.1 bacterial transcriptional regulator family protein [Bordetella holmesii 41130]EWM47814.1 bacterial transcriptional regulator family protein [Bordetella holmesii 35009]EWM51981.1 bacterial transcriptional regulator family protein [Bordetella h